jgi:hypothetical protein
MSRSLRRLFAIIMVFYEATNIHNMWHKHFESISEDYRHTVGNEKRVQQMVLKDIDDIVRVMGKDIQTYGLPELDDHENE